MVEPDASTADLLEPLFYVYTTSYVALRDVHQILAERRHAISGTRL